MVRYWVHNGFVNINNEKMSKSLKNFKTLRDIVSQEIDARAFRYMVSNKVHCALFLYESLYILYNIKFIDYFVIIW